MLLWNCSRPQRPHAICNGKAPVRTLRHWPVHYGLEPRYRYTILRRFQAVWHQSPTGDPGIPTLLTSLFSSLYNPEPTLTTTMFRRSIADLTTTTIEGLPNDPTTGSDVPAINRRPSYDDRRSPHRHYDSYRKNSYGCRTLRL